MTSYLDKLTDEQLKRREELLTLLAGYSWLRFHHRDGHERVEKMQYGYTFMTWDDPDKLQEEGEVIWYELRVIVHQLLGTPRLVTKADLKDMRADLSLADLKALEDTPPRAREMSAMRADLYQRSLEAADKIEDYAPKFTLLGWAQRKDVFDGPVGPGVDDSTPVQSS